MAQLELVHPRESGEPRGDHSVITHLVDEGARVLDVGCGDGALLALLARECKTRGSGLERNPNLVRASIARGLSAAQGDADADLADFPSGTFDVVILSHTLQQLRDPRAALKQAARIGARVIISIKNAAYTPARARLAFGGRAANWDQLHRPISVRDMAELARACGLTIETAVPLTKGRAGAPFAKVLWRANWFAEEAVFLLQS
ncbi:MAG TPA: methionine biosynthesis protein MetW [Terricaulis sp.]|nr:methionine biosynthesis protein MetW [Terricaulis sp.]